MLNKQSHLSGGWLALFIVAIIVDVGHWVVWSCLPSKVTGGKKSNKFTNPLALAQTRKQRRNCESARD